MLDSTMALDQLSAAVTPGPWQVSGIQRAYSESSCVLVNSFRAGRLVPAPPAPSTLAAEVVR